MSTQQAAETRYVEISGIRFAYRHFGKSSQVPLALMQHYRGTMDHWDPAFINRLAEQRSVFLFDNTGIGKTSGEIPTTFAGWAGNLILLLGALQIKQVDLLGFSMGGCAAQMVALNAPQLVRKLILAGTAPSAGPGTVAGDTAVFSQIVRSATLEENRVGIEKTFYYPTEAGRAIARASWDRINERQQDRSDFLQGEGITRQIAAFQQWSAPDPRNSYDRLHELSMPVLIANGDRDVIVPTANSFVLYERIPNARLAIYPGAGHGFLYQHAPEFTSQIQKFLDNETQKVSIPMNGFQSKL